MVSNLLPIQHNIIKYLWNLYLIIDSMHRQINLQTKLTKLHQLNRLTNNCTLIVCLFYFLAVIISFFFKYLGNQLLWLKINNRQQTDNLFEILYFLLSYDSFLFHIKFLLLISCSFLYTHIYLPINKYEERTIRTASTMCLYSQIDNIINLCVYCVVRDPILLYVL